ncbi:hypothetical protein MPSEU_000004100 [Mayamaea pseudoterrestris]|nr:hypothetical protein MPSEU_000004100 [Mayamaea pseudoterrestris]
MSSTIAQEHEVTICNEQESSSSNLDALNDQDMEHIAAATASMNLVSPSPPSIRNDARRTSSSVFETSTFHTTTSSPTMTQATPTTAFGRSVSDHKTPIGWEQPEWATKERKLRPTNASTSPVHLGGSEHDKKKKAIEWEKPDWAVKPLLKESWSGHQAKTTGDLQKPITKATDKDLRGTMDDFNAEATPMILKSTQQGGAVRSGHDLAKRITMVQKDPLADVNFEANPHFVLRNTPLGHAVKRGTSLSKPVTHCYKPEGMGVNFDVNPALLKPTPKGKLVKTKGDLQKPITAATVLKGNFDSLNFEANPMILKPTEQGSLVRLGEKLERPITHIRQAGTSVSGAVNVAADKDWHGSSQVGQGDNEMKNDTLVQQPDEDDFAALSNNINSTNYDEEGEWEDFASQEDPSDSNALGDEEELALDSEELEGAFNDTFGHESELVVTNSL